MEEMPKRQKKRAKRGPQPPERRFRLYPEHREKIDPEAIAEMYMNIATRMVAEQEGKIVDPAILDYQTMLANAESNLPRNKEKTG